MGSQFAKQAKIERLQNLSYQREKKYTAPELKLLEPEAYEHQMAQRARRLARPRKPGTFKQKRRNQLRGQRY